MLQYGHPSDSSYKYYSMMTSAESGTISTKHFGEQFDAEKVQTRLSYTITINSPKSVRNSSNVTLHFMIEKISLKDLSTGKDSFYGDTYTKLDEAELLFCKNFTPPSGNGQTISLYRDVILPDVWKQQLNLMPGFRFKWYYTGTKIEPEANYYKVNKAFIRNDSINV